MIGSFHLSAPGFVAGLGAGSGPPAPSFDKTRFAFFGEAYAPGNTAGQLSDQSGHGQHFTQADPARQAVYSTDAQGVGRYQTATAGAANYWNSPLTAAAGSLEFHLVADLADAATAYFFDGNGHSILIGQTELLYYSPAFGFQGGSQALGPGKAVYSWLLDAAAGTGTVLRNGAAVFTGSYVAAALDLGRLGGDYTTENYGAIRGYLYAFAVATGLGTPAEQAATISYLAGQANITL